jgi:hypothetical protein
MTAKQLRKQFNYFNKIYFSNKLPLVKIVTYKKVWVNDTVGKISPVRKRNWDKVLGVYQHRGGKPFRIVVAQDQPPVQQLCTLVHEMQHMSDYQYKGSTNHGKEFMKRVRFMEKSIYTEYFMDHIKELNLMSEAMLLVPPTNKLMAQLLKKAKRQYNAYAKNVIDMIKTKGQKELLKKINYLRLK